MTSRHPKPIVCACLMVFCDIPDLVALTAHLHLLPWISYYKALFQHEAHPTVIFRPQTRGAKTPKTTTWRSSMLLGGIQEDLFILRCTLHTRIKTNRCPAPPPSTLQSTCTPLHHSMPMRQQSTLADSHSLVKHVTNPNMHMQETYMLNTTLAPPVGKSLTLASPSQADPKAFSLNLILRPRHTRLDRAPTHACGIDNHPQQQAIPSRPCGCVRLTMPVVVGHCCLGCAA
jgi:hypothetical protein